MTETPHYSNEDMQSFLLANQLKEVLTRDVLPIARKGRVHVAQGLLEKALKEQYPTIANTDLQYSVFPKRKSLEEDLSDNMTAIGFTNLGTALKYLVELAEFSEKTALSNDTFIFRVAQSLSKTLEFELNFGEETDLAWEDVPGDSPSINTTEKDKKN